MVEENRDGQLGSEQGDDGFELKLPETPEPEAPKQEEFNEEQERKAIEERFQMRMAELKKVQDEMEDEMSLLPDNDDLVKSVENQKLLAAKRQQIGLERDAAMTVLMDEAKTASSEKSDEKMDALKNRLKEI